MEKNFKIYSFNQAYQAPEYKWDAKNGFITWGSDNNYPQYLIDLYNINGSATHKSIINKKSRLATGYGIKPVTNPELAKFIKDKKLEKLFRRLEKDFEIFNGYAFEIVWNNDGSDFSINYVPFHKIRIGIQNEEYSEPHFWFSTDWTKYKKEEYKPQYIAKFDPNIRKGKQLYYYTEENPQADDLYPIAGYSSAINWIELDYEVSKFHLNQVKQGFAPSFILNFATGIPTEEEMDEFYRDFKRNYSSAENAGKIIITYSEGADGKPELIPIQLNDSDERFIMLQDMVEKNIVMGHEVPPQLVILTPGKLGSTDERKELLREFQSYYITPRQEQLEEGVNEAVSLLGFGEEVKLNEYKDVENKDNKQIIQ